MFESQHDILFENQPSISKFRDRWNLHMTDCIEYMIPAQCMNEDDLRLSANPNVYMCYTGCPKKRNGRFLEFCSIHTVILLTSIDRASFPL